MVKSIAEGGTVHCASVEKLTSENEVLAEFAKPGFDVKEKVKSVLQGSGSIGDQLEILTSGIEVVEKELKTQVSDHYEDLLSQATGVEKLEKVLNVMVTKSDTLLTSVERVRNKVIEPFNRMEEQTLLVFRLQESCDLLRRVIRTLNISKRLQQQLGQVKEITKAAQSLNELDYLAKDVDLTGLSVLEKDQRLIKQARAQVEKQGESMLSSGIESQNQTQVATALQVFYNLGSLGQIVEQLLSNSRKELLQQVTSTFDVKSLSSTSSSSGSSDTSRQPGKSSMPTPGQAAAFRAALWINMEKLMEFVHVSCVKIHHLQKVLSKKRDPVTGISFMEELAGTEAGTRPLMEIFWKDVTMVLSVELVKAAQQSSFVKQSFEGEYPKLLRLSSDLWKKLASLTDSPSLGNDGEGEDRFDPERALRDVLTPFEAAYLSRSLSRLFDPVNLMFEGVGEVGGETGGPKKEEVDACVKAVSSELHVAAVDPYLCTIVARNVAKTVKLFGVKVENLACPGDSDAIQVVNPPTQVQLLNAKLVEILYYLTQQIESRAIGGTLFPGQVKQIISDSLKEVDQLMKNIASPWIEAIGKSLQNIVGTIHYENFHDDSVDKSAWVDEFGAFVSRVKTSYLCLFEECGSSFSSGLLAPIVRRTLHYFVLQVSLVRPIDSPTSSKGRKRLESDFTTMETHLARLFPNLKSLNPEFRRFKAMKSILFLSPVELSQSDVVGDAVPLSTALYFMFSRCPEAMKSPHQQLRMSPEVFLEFVESKSEQEKLGQIRECLETYANEARKSGNPFPDVYRTMVDFLARAF